MKFKYKNKDKPKKKRFKKFVYFPVFTLMALITVISLIIPQKQPSYIYADSDLSDPSQWYKWTQFNGEWGQQWGTKPGGSNVGCYLTSIAIQGARGGMTKTKAGKKWNPLNLNTRGDQTGSTAGDNGFKMMSSEGNFVSNCLAGPSMGGKDKVNDAIKKITKRGQFPIVHVDQAAGYPYETHYMAFRKMDGDKMTLYDPALYQGKDTADNVGGLDKLYKMVAWVEGWGGAPKDYSKAKSPAQEGASGQKDEGENGGETDNNSSSDNNSNVNKQGEGAPIHVLFNPFRTQMNNGSITQVGANTDIEPVNNATIMALKGYNWYDLMGKVQNFALISMYILIAWIMISGMLLLCDSWGGGIIQGAVRTIGDRFPLMNKIFFPKGLFMGIIEEGSTFKLTVKLGVELLFMILLFTLCCTGSLSMIASWFFQMIDKISF